MDVGRRDLAGGHESEGQLAPHPLLGRPRIPKNLRIDPVNYNLRAAEAQHGAATAAAPLGLREAREGEETKPGRHGKNRQVRYSESEPTEVGRQFHDTNRSELQPADAEKVRKGEKTTTRWVSLSSRQEKETKSPCLSSPYLNRSNLAAHTPPSSPSPSNYYPIVHIHIPHTPEPELETKPRTGPTSKLGDTKALTGPRVCV